jgi:hypothetical protein
MISQKELKAIIHYDPNTGEVFWLKSGSGRRKDLRAGALSSEDPYGYRYMRITIKQVEYRLSHIIVRYMTNQIPFQVDHEDHNPLNNKWDNLVIHYDQSNQRNKSLYKRNTAGVPGIYKNKFNSYVVWIGSGKGGRPKYLGSYKDFFEACCVRKSAENKYDFHPNHGRK